MFALIIGIIFIAFCVFACLPAGIGLAWSGEIIAFLKGFAPCFAALAGFVAILIGIADIKDRREARKEEALAKKAQEEKAE